MLSGPGAGETWLPSRAHAGALVAPRMRSPWAASSSAGGRRAGSGPATCGAEVMSPVDGCVRAVHGGRLRSGHGRGWLDAGGAYVNTTVTSAHAFALQDIAIRGRAMKTVTTVAVNRPVPPNGPLQNSDQLLFRGGSSTRRSTMGARVRISTYAAGTTSLSKVQSGVPTANGRTAAYHSTRGWLSIGQTSILIGDVLSSWDASGVSSICGGANVPGSTNCPHYCATISSHHHHVSSFPRELYVRRGLAAAAARARRAPSALRAPTMTLPRAVIPEALGPPRHLEVAARGPAPPGRRGPELHWGRASWARPIALSVDPRRPA
jgi:hypothetical protein